MTKQTVRKRKKLLSPKAGALSSPSQEIRVPPTKESTRESGLSIRTELLAHATAKFSLAKQIPIDQLLKIEKVAT
jgi:hypothetical protein